MPDWTNATHPTASTGGVLRPHELARHMSLDRRPPGERAAPWVENRWHLAWDLPGGRWFDSEVLPHPTVSLTVEVGSHPRPDLPAGERVVVTGVCTRRFDVEIRGTGTVHGLRFRPGALASLTGADARAWVDRSVPARLVLPADLVDRLADPALVGRGDTWAAMAEAGVADLGAEAQDERYVRLLHIVTDLLADHSLVTVAEIARRHATTPRTLQRLFLRYLGVGPKWVLMRYRMHDVVTELDTGFDGSMADLAVRHGWYDQAHFTRDFTALVGVPPGEYRSGSPATPGGRAG